MTIVFPLLAKAPYDPDSVEQPRAISALDAVKSNQRLPRAQDMEIAYAFLNRPNDIGLHVDNGVPEFVTDINAALALRDHLLGDDWALEIQEVIIDNSGRLYHATARSLTQDRMLPRAYAFADAALGRAIVMTTLRAAFADLPAQKALHTAVSTGKYTEAMQRPDMAEAAKYALLIETDPMSRQQMLADFGAEVGAISSLARKLSVQDTPVPVVESAPPPTPSTPTVTLPPVVESAPPPPPVVTPPQPPAPPVVPPSPPMSPPPMVTNLPPPPIPPALAPMQVSATRTPPPIPDFLKR